ncbi:metal-sulfur cluster assembly factor, partial [Streptomyces sp. NPDC004980]
MITEADVRAALAKVDDPEIRKPITELGMVKSIAIAESGDVHVEVYLTTSGCPLRTEIVQRVTKAVADVPGAGAVTVDLDVMSDEQRTELRKSLRGDSAEPAGLRPDFVVNTGDNLSDPEGCEPLPLQPLQLL